MTDNTTAVEATPVREMIPADFDDLLAMVPVLGGDEGAAMYAAILAAETPDDLSAPWQGGSLRDRCDMEIEVRAIEQGESTYENGLPFFLLVRGVDVATGESVNITTGSASVCAQLLKAHAAGWFPLRVIPRGVQSKRNPQNTIYHLDIVPRQ